MSESNKELLEEIMDATILAIENADFNNGLDVQIVSNFLDCCKTAIKLPTKKKIKREWVKPWRQKRENNRSFSFLLKELSNDVSSFFAYLCMNEDTFNYILSAIKVDIIKKDTLLRQSIPPDEKLAATLRFLATGESYSSVSLKTRLSESFLCQAVPEVCRAIWNKFKGEYLKFPTTKNEWELIADQFAIKWQFPHCLGALDEKNINFQRNKGTNSIVLLALVDAECRFIHINVGYNGSHGAGVFLQSDLIDVIGDAENHFPADKVIGNGRHLPYVIVAGDAFPLQKHIMKSYSEGTNVKQMQIFNIRLSRARHVVDHAFSILSNRFRIFQQRINMSVENVELVTKACCVLHNLLSKKSSSYLQITTSEIVLESETSSPAIVGNGQSAAEHVRQEFQDYFNNEGKVDWQDNKL